MVTDQLSPTPDLPVGIAADEFVARYPRLYHMAEAGSWAGIKSHGLLSTSALLDLFEIGGAEREAIEGQHRLESVVITHPVHGSATIRDQKPMDDVGLTRALGDGITPGEWYQLLNGFVFFWVSESRLKRLLGARAYRKKRQTVLVVNTAALLEENLERCYLSPMNSGATKPMPHPRGADTFLPLAAYPFAAWERKRRGRGVVVEVAVRGQVAIVDGLVERVYLTGGGLADEVLYTSHQSE